MNFLTIRYVIGMLEKLSEFDRAELFARIRSRFCVRCGKDLAMGTPDPRGCQCENDTKRVS